MTHAVGRFTTTLLGAALALSLAAGCASNGTNQAGEQMSSALAAAGTENDRHASTCRSAASMDDMLADVNRHVQTMDGLMSRMDDARNQMGSGSTMMSMHCSGTDFDQMCSSLSDMHQEVGDHSDRMQAATSLEDARAACATYADAMRETMRNMHDDLDGMSCMHM